MTDTLQSDIVYALSVSPTFAQDGIAFAAQQSGLYRSEDGGASWTPTYDSLNLPSTLPTLTVVLSPDFSRDATVFAGVGGGVLRSNDGGQTWTMTALSLPAPAITILALSPNFAEDGLVFAGSMEDGFFVSADKGHQWRTWNFGLLDLNVLCLAIDPDFKHSEILFAGTENGLFRSTNSGHSWREVNFPSEHAPILSLAVRQNRLFAGTEASGLFISDDSGLSWSQPIHETLDDSVNGIALAQTFPATPHILLALSSRIMFSPDGGKSWTLRSELPDEQQMTCFAAPMGVQEDSPLLVGTADSGILQL